MARGKDRHNGGRNSKGRVSNTRAMTKVVDVAGNNGFTTQAIVADNNGPTSLPIDSSNNGSTSIPIGAGNNGSASPPLCASNNGSTSIPIGAGNNGSISQAMNVSNNGPASLPTANEPATEESVDLNSHGSVGNETTSGPTPSNNHPSMYDAINVSRTVNGRRVIQVVANELWPSCARPIWKIFELKVDINGCAWKKISTETKNFYFEEFRKRFYWEEPMEALVKSAWEAKAKTRYGNMISDANKKRQRLDFIPQNIWDEWQKYFTSEEFLRISRRNTENRKKANDGAGPSCHTGGSIPHAEHAKRLSKKLGRYPTFHELFTELHTRKHDGVTFVDDKASEVNERVINLRGHRLEQQETLEEIDESEIFVEAVAGKRSDRIYGIGSLGNLYCHNGCSTSAAPSSSTQYSPAVEQQVQQLVEKKVNEVLDERVESRFRELMKQMFPNQDIPPFPPPPN
ncbi:uncharacterized protein [Euphorbia lathyris]|uniref:uncharacterized protein n=1 Tax=Euphorbia lathyris TaxID=212925 RepID=UPI003313C3C1